MNDYIIRFIIELAKNAKKGRKRFESYIRSSQNGIDETELYNCRYLLSQILRHYKLPKGHRHISKKAKELWENITSANPKDYEYAESILCDNLTVTKSVNTYKGSSHTIIKRDLQKGNKVKFNDIFTTEHVIPINMIVDELVEIAGNSSLNEDETYSQIKATLSKIHTCIITKEEDRAIKNSRKREGVFEDIIKNEYNQAGIEVVEEPIE